MTSARYSRDPQSHLIDDIVMLGIRPSNHRTTPVSRPSSPSDRPKEFFNGTPFALQNHEKQTVALTFRQTAPLAQKPPVGHLCWAGKVGVLASHIQNGTIPACRQT